MSRPPRPHPPRPTKQRLLREGGTLDYLPLEHDDLVALQEQLAAAELDLEPVGGAGDFTSSLFDLSAVVAHVLATYQDRYAGEAFLGTAQSPRSLIKHGRRLSYEPDPGVASVGYVSVAVVEGLRGTIARGLPLSSAPQGEDKAQDYETLADRLVDAAWNRLSISDATEPAGSYDSTNKIFAIEGTGHGLELGEPMMVAGTGPNWVGAFRADLIEEDPARNVTFVRVGVGNDSSGAGLYDPAPPWHRWTNHHLYARPRLRFRPFGWNADHAVFPETDIRMALEYPDTEPDPNWMPAPVFGYVCDSYDHEDVYLATQIEDALDGTYAMGVNGTSLSYHYVNPDSQANVSVVLKKAFPVRVPFSVSVNPSTGAVTTLYHKVLQHVWLSGAVTRVTMAGSSMGRMNIPLGTIFLGGWERKLPVRHTQPSEDEITEGSLVVLEGRLEGLLPGMYLSLTDTTESAVQIVELTRVDVPGEEATDPVTTVQWRRVAGAEASHVWEKGYLVIRGNVLKVSHGSSKAQVLGDSDGITPFLRFAIKQPRVTQLPSGTGATPELVVRVGGVRWTAVEHFGDSGANDRHYVLQRDEEQITHVLFGDGAHGAIPPAGRRHVTAEFRVGLGVDGNVEPRRVTRLKQAHPLLDGVTHRVAIGGGTEPATSEDVRTQATRFIRTFDRAVSVKDHADLALLFPGVARSAARWHAGAIELVVATAEGTAHADKAELKTFLDLRRDTSIPLAELRDPAPLGVHVELTVEHDQDFLAENVKRAVREVLGGDAGLFAFASRDLGQPVHLSELHALLEPVAGVRFIEVTHFALTAGTGNVHDVIRVRMHEWLSLAAGSLTINMAGGS